MRGRGMKRTIVLILVICCLLLPSSAFAEIDKADQSHELISIGALLPLSGELATKGVIIKSAIELAVEDATAYLTKSGRDYKIKVIVEDTKSEPMETLAQDEKLQQKVTNLFIAGSSAEVSHLKEWSEVKNTIVISYNSTAPSLSISGDGIFRVNPNDIHQAQTISTLLNSENIKHIVPVYRNDVYGEELSELIITNFQDQGGTFAEPVLYKPNTSDFATVIEEIDERLDKSDVDRSTTGIVLVAFDEASQLFTQAESLNDVRWFTSETITLNDSIVQDPVAAAFAESVKLTGVTFGIQDSSYYEEVTRRLKQYVDAEVTIIPEAIFAYDIPWMLASALQRMEELGNPIELKEQLIEFSQYYVGATGWMVLDDAGDRKYSLYDIWQVQNGETSLEWVKVGIYRRDPGFPGYIIETGRDATLPEAGSGIEQLPLDDGMTRAEYAYMLVHAFELQRAENAKSFPDLDSLDSSMQEALSIAANHGIVLGYDDGTFRPGLAINRTEMIVMLVRAMKLPASKNGEPSIAFADQDSIPSWAKADIASALEVGILTPDEDNRFDPNEPITMQEALEVTLQALLIQ